MSGRGKGFKKWKNETNGKCGKKNMQYISLVKKGQNDMPNNDIKVNISMQSIREEKQNELENNDTKMNEIIQCSKWFIQDDNENMESKVDNEITNVQSGSVQYVNVGAETMLPRFVGNCLISQNLQEIMTG